jgi:ABC-type glycerol-3-phosphate transport system permease component
MASMIGDKRVPFPRNQAAFADLFTIACGVVLLMTAGYLWLADTDLGFNINVVMIAVSAMIFGGLGLYNPNLSRWTSYGAAIVGLNAIFYHLSIYGQACQFTLELSAIYWLGALASGGILGQVIVSRAQVNLQQRKTGADDLTAGVQPKQVRSRIPTGTIVLYIVLTFFAFVAIIPFLWMISTSFMTLGETINRTWVPGELQVCNYYEAWQTAKFNLYFFNSVIIAITTIGGLLVVSILSAYAFARIKFFGSSLLFTLLLATLMVPEIVVMIPNFLTINGQIFEIPVTQSSFPFFEFGMSGRFNWMDTLPALSVPFMGSAFSIFLLRQFFMQIPNELWEAARIDGAGHLRFLLQIVIPISRAPILTVVLLTFIGSWNSLLWPLLVTTDPEAWRPISYGLQAFSDEAGTQTHLLTAGAFITILPMVVLYFLTQKTFTEGIATTGLKG